MAKSALNASEETATPPAAPVETPTAPKPSDEGESGPAPKPTSKPVAKPTPKVEPPKHVDWWEALKNGDDEGLTEGVKRNLEEIIAKHSAALGNYELLFLFDDDSIDTFHSDRLYSAASVLKGKKKDILLIVNSQADGLNLRI
jgi:hypothetical protein